MRAGQLKHRVELQRAARVQNERSGQMEDTWETYATVWAKVEPLSGGEQVYAHQVAADTSHLVRMRFLEGVLAADRVLHGGRPLYITRPINVDERGIALELLCTENIA